VSGSLISAYSLKKQVSFLAHLLYLVPSETMVSLNLRSAETFVMDKK
jgi:hypothetical protein